MNKTSAALCALLLLPFTVQGAIVAQYPFETGFSSTDTEPLTTAGDFLGQATGGFAVEFGVLGTPVGASSQTLAWSARAERDAASTWFDFTIALEPGTSEISFTSLAFDAFVFHTVGGTTAFNYRLFWDVDGFATAIASATGPSITSDTGTSANANASFLLDLSALPAQTTGVTFRLDPFFAAGSGTNGGGAVASSQRGGAIDNVVLNATASAASVPLPGTLLLLATGGLALIGRGRFGRRQS